jgi:hypothetical protein
MIPFTQHNSRTVKQRFIKHRQISGQSPAASLPRCLEISGHRQAPWKLNETLIPESALRYYYVNPVGLCATQGAVPSSGHSNCDPLRLRPDRAARICAISHSWTGGRRARNCCATPKQASCLTNTLPKMDRPCSPMRASSAPSASFRRKSMAPTNPTHAASGSRSAIPPASPCRSQNYA